MAFGTTPSNSTQYALWNASPPRKVKGRLWGDNGRYYASNAAATQAAGSQINMVQLQAGQVVLGGRMWWAALGASTQFWLGDAGDCDRYKTATNGAVASLNHTDATAGGDCTLLNAATGIGYEVTSTTTDVILTFSYAAATSALSAGDIKLVLEVG
jgi:hypothetical protein